MIATILRLLISIPGMPTFKAKITPTPTILPGNATEEEAFSALLGAGLYRGALVVAGFAAIIILCVVAWSKIER